MIDKKNKLNYGFLFILPALLLFLFVFLNPIIRMIWYSAVNWDYFVPGNFNWFKNYLELINTRYFLTSIQNNLIIVAIVIPFTLIIGLYFAQFIYLKIKFYKFYTFLFFIPVILPEIVVAEVMISLLNKVGPINTLFGKIGLDFLIVDWLGNPRFSLLAIIISIIWKSVGFGMILFLARLTTIDRSIYESAQIDGATEMQVFRYITIPILRNVIQLYVVLMLIGLMSTLFNYIYLMTNGGPGFSSTPLEYFVYLNAFNLGNMGKANSAGVVLIIITVLLIILFMRVLKFQKVE